MTGQALHRHRRYSLQHLLEQKSFPRHIESQNTAFLTSLRGLTGILRQSPFALRMMRFVARQGVSVGTDALLESSSSYFYSAHNSFDLGWQDASVQKTEKGVCRYLFSFIGALRHAWHYHRGLETAQRYKPCDAVSFSRYVEADVQAVIHHIAWELRTSGHTFLWRSLMTGIHADIATTYQRMIEEEPKAQFNGMALHAAFDQWFECETRIDIIDKRILDIIDMMLPERMNSSMFQTMNHQHRCQIGLLPDGRNYLSGCFFVDPRYTVPLNEQNAQWLAQIENDLANMLIPVRRF